MKFPEIDRRFLLNLMEQAFYLTIMVWFMRLGVLHIPLMDGTELLLILQGALYCVVMVMTLVPSIHFLVRHAEVGLDRGEKIEWAVVAAIFVVSGYLWFTA